MSPKTTPSNQAQAGKPNRFPLAPYHSGRCFYRFRFNLDYSGGQVTNFGTHMLDIAMRLKRSIKWNPDTESLVGDDEAIALLSRTPRDPWSYSN